MEYRRATLEDLEPFLENRLEFVKLIRQVEDLKGFKEKTRAYLLQHINEADLLIYIAVEEGEIISSCMACLFETVPLPSCLSGKMAELLNVYTKEAYRGQGHMKKLIELLIEEARSLGVGKMILNYTRDGYPLYKKMGFTEIEQQMELRL